VRFAGRLSRTEFVELIDKRHDEVRRSIGLLRLYGLADWSGPRTIGQWGWSNGVLSEAGLAYGAPDTPGPWVQIVTTADSAEKWVNHQRASTALGAERHPGVETHQRVIDALRAEPPGEATIEVDGEATTFRYWPQPATDGDDHPGWYAARAGVPGLAVEAHGLDPHEVRLVAVTDVEPYLAATREHLLATYDASQAP
jgi:hypothetical protein